jgi:hypothetical protein
VKISFRSTPYVNGDTDLVDPLYRNVEMLVNGKRWLLDMGVSREHVSSSPYDCARSGIIRAQSFPDEIRHDLHVEPQVLIEALYYDQYNYPEWVR